MITQLIENLIIKGIKLVVREKCNFCEKKFPIGDGYHSQPGKPMNMISCPQCTSDLEYWAAGACNTHERTYPFTSSF